MMQVDDLSDLAPFEGATNRTAVFLSRKSKTKTEYPVRYDVWLSATKEHIEQYGSYAEVLEAVQIKRKAAQPSSPLAEDSAWITAERDVLNGLSRAMGESSYVAREGVNAGGLSGCFWIRILSQQGKLLLIENLNRAGKKVLDQVQAAIEPDLVYPLLRGRDVSRWRAEPKAHILAPQDPNKRREGLPEAELKRAYPRTHAYLKAFESELTARADRKYYPPGSPFYTMRNVANYTRSKWKVVFKDLSEVLQCAVVGSSHVSSDLKPVFPDLTLRLIAATSGDEAHYIAALLNSSPSLVVLHASSVGVQTQRYHPGDIAKLRVPLFDPGSETHQELSTLSKRCHQLVADDMAQSLMPVEEELDATAAELWGITPQELKEIRQALLDIYGHKQVVMATGQDLD
ncbi:MAG TPA: hypothetical protein VE863_22705 [Pyrinomonadaceae bacterium]|nr:hypothetical protein [Pyrinomonadaceae bacterium]